jgi:hypothetical protein
MIPLSSHLIKEKNRKNEIFYLYLSTCYTKRPKGGNGFFSSSKNHIIPQVAREAEKQGNRTRKNIRSGSN